jgi:nucleotide-binding universal stress UspA family protein
MSDRVPRYRSVLVPLDGSRLAEGILPFIVQLAGPLDMKIVLLRVVPPVVPDKPLTDPQVVVDDMAAQVTEARHYVAGVAADLWCRGIRVQVRVRGGFPVTEIVTAAKEAGVDFIAMSTHGRRAFGRLLLGSVAEAVLREAPGPVLLKRVIASAVRKESAQIAA